MMSYNKKLNEKAYTLKDKEGTHEPQTQWALGPIPLWNILGFLVE